MGDLSPSGFTSNSSELFSSVVNFGIVLSSTDPLGFGRTHQGPDAAKGWNEFMEPLSFTGQCQFDGCSLTAVSINWFLCFVLFFFTFSHMRRRNCRIAFIKL